MGINPAWKDSFNFRIDKEEVITFEIWDYDSLSRNDYIANGSYSLANVLK